jgi:hypothetical protein
MSCALSVPSHAMPCLENLDNINQSNKANRDVDIHTFFCRGNDWSKLFFEDIPSFNYQSKDSVCVEKIDRIFMKDSYRYFSYFWQQQRCEDSSLRRGEVNVSGSQCWRSGSGSGSGSVKDPHFLDPWIRIRIRNFADPDPDPLTDVFNGFLVKF